MDEHDKAIKAYQKVLEIRSKLFTEESEEIAEIYYWYFQISFKIK